MDYSKVSTEDLKNYQAGNTAAISTEGLRLLTAQQPAQAPATPAQLRGQKIDSYLAETDKMLGLTPGTSARQINVESRFDDAAHNVGSGARGISQVIEATRASLSKRFGRELDSHNTDDALMMHREVMRENMGKWGNESDALRAYNSGWVPSKWGNDETTNYIKQIVGEDGSFELPSKGGGVNPANRAYPPAPKDMKETALNSNQDFLSASEQMYMGVEERNFLGTDEDLAEWGKKYIWDFNNNLGRMAQRTTQVMSGTQEEKEAMLYMMEAFDNTDISFAGTWRSIKAASYDPTTYASFAALGIGTVGKVLTAAAAKEGVKKALLTALGRTGIVAGVETGIIGAAESTMKQSIRVDAGAQAEFSNAQLAIDTSVSAALGVVVGSAGDLLAQKMAPAASRKLSEFRKWIRPDAAKETASSTVGNTVEVTYNPASGLPLSPEDAAKVVELRAGGPEGVLEGAAPPVTATPATPAAPPSIILPNDLAKAKPRWKTSQIVFESDIDKALYITAQQSPSKRDLDYRNFLREHGYSETDINVGGVELRQRMNAIGAKLNAGESFVVPKGEGSKWVDPASLGPSTGPASSNQVSSNRRQKGRQWVDDLPPVTPANPEAAARLTVPPSGTGQRGTPRTHDASRANGSAVERQLDNMTNEELHGVIEAERLQMGNRTMEDYATVTLGIQFHTTKVQDELAAVLTKLKEVLSVEEYAKTLARMTQLEGRLVALQLGDDTFGTTAGSLLNQRKIGEKIIPSIAQMMDEDKMTRPEAETLFQRLHASTRQDAIVQQAMFPHDEAIAAAIKVGDSSEILRLQVVKRMELEALVETIIPKAGSFMARVTEGAISNVLSGTSLIVNVAYSAPKTLLIPALQALISDPLKRATRIRMAGAYSSMASTVSHSFTAAMDVWRYEQLILTRDSFKLLDGPMANTGRFGGALRVIPRLMATMDEFLTQINYVGFIGGRAREKAYLEAVEQKMSPKLTEAYMKAETAKAIAGAFAVNSGETLLQPIVNKGVNRGFRGEELNEWVMKEVSRAHALEPGNNKEALEFARDMLYQRKWSKENFWSKGASKYEELISEYPGLRLVIGQLFFRTPIRVFEEGVRLTPGLQFAAPGFMKDLAGLNGETRQLRAQGEALMSTAIAGWTLSQYARGEITGAGGSDSYKQERLKADTGGDGAYTLGDTDSKWNYRNYDPVAFPMKVMVTAMELMDKMHTRQAQGDAPDLKQEQQVMAYMAVGVQSIAMAIRDANLMAGVAMAIDTGKVMMDPEKGLNQATMKYVGERLSWVLPSTMTKIAKSNDPTLKDPATYWQMVEERLAGIYIDISDVKSSYSYDIFGNVRTTKDTGRLWNTFSTTTQEEREGDLTPSMIYVGKELDKLSQITGAKFETPIKFAELGDLDMRTLMTADGKETLYDRWNRFYRSRDPAERVAQILRMNLSSGTFKNKGPMVAEVQGVLKLYRELAFYDMRKTEQVVLDRHRKEMRDKASAESGRTGLDWFN
tara:strand:- start:557 stop:5038 length:4482 start_codon:yes stop_codon:yes gene_type:complete